MLGEVDDNMTPLGHVSKQMKVEHHEDGIPIGNQNRIDAVTNSTMKNLVSRPEIECHTGSRNPDESNAEILALLRSLLEC